MTSTPHPFCCETCKKRLYDSPEDCPCEKDYEQLLEHRVSVSDIELIMSISGCASHSSSGMCNKDGLLNEIYSKLMAISINNANPGWCEIKEIAKLFKQLQQGDK